MSFSRGIGTALGALAWALAAASSAGGAVVLEGRMLDGQASSRVVLEKFRNQNEDVEALKVPWADKDVTVLLVNTAQPRGAAGEEKRWSVRTGAGGEFRVDTGLEAVPEGSYFVAQSSEGKPRYSPFFKPGLPEARSISLYPLTESTEDIFIPSFSIVHDFADLMPGTGPEAMKPSQYKGVRVRVALQIWNRGGEMYVGRRDGSPHRSVWKVPLPEGARLVLNQGPDPGTPGFTLSEDGRWLVLDSPIPGLSDIKRFGNYEAHFVVPASQTLVFSYPIALPVEGTRFAVWCVHEEMSLRSPGFLDPDSKTYPDPLGGGGTAKFDVIGAKKNFSPGESATIVLGVDNVPLGQVSAHAAKWVGGFILLLAVAALAGLAVGRKGPAPDTLFAGVKGEEILDRIADLDARHARKAIREKDYVRYREALFALAAEELGDEVGAARAGGPGAAAGLPPAARDILRRIDELDRNGAGDPARIAERAHLLEALAKALPRERPRG